MPRTGDTISAPLNGVSQQPPVLRFPTQVSEQINAESSPTRGLIKRKPTRHIKSLYSPTEDGPFVQFITRDSIERYVLIVDANTPKVFNRDTGLEYLVQTPDGTSYLTCDVARDSLRAVTVQDSTYILNRDVVAKMADTVSPFTNEVVVWIRQGQYATDYTLKVAGHSVTKTTSDTDFNDIKTSNVASTLLTDITAALGAGWSFRHRTGDSVFTIRKDDNSTFEAEVICSAGEDRMECIVNRTQLFSNLPSICTNGYVCRVLGDVQAAEDDYWVHFVTHSASDDIGDGTWVEIARPDIQNQPDAATLPLRLDRLEDDALGSLTGTPYKVYFRLAKVAWAPRDSGDEVSSKVPSFINRRIKNLIMHLGRLFFLTDVSVVSSRAGDLEDFWRGTATTVTDADPVDLDVPVSGTVHAAVTISRQLIVFGDKVQMVLEGGDHLAPANASLTAKTRYQMSESCDPIAISDMAFFTYNNGAYGGVREYRPETYNTRASVFETSLIIPAYLPPDARAIVASAVDSRVFYLGSTRNLLGVYRWVQNGTDRVMASWSTWDVQGVVLGMHIDGSELYLIIRRDGVACLEAVALSDQASDAGLVFQIHLDRRVTDADCTASFVGGYTTLLLPYATDSSVSVLTSGTADDPVATITVEQDTDPVTGFARVRFAGEVPDGGLILGIPYEFRIDLSPFFVRAQTASGGQVGTKPGKLQIVRTRFDLTGSGYAKVRVTHQDGAYYDTEFTALVAGLTVIGSVSDDSKELWAGIFGDSIESQIQVLSSSPLPTQISAIEWEGQFSPRMRK